MSLPALLAAAIALEDGLRVTVPADWHQGRTCYGGLSSALALAAAMRIAPDLPALRSAQISFVGPLFGTVEVRARLRRSGRNAHWVSAEVAGEAGIGLISSFVFMGPGESAAQLNGCPPPDGLVPFDLAEPLPAGIGSTFLQNHFDVRFALPRNETRKPEFCWWVRARARSGLDPFTEALLCADALPPGVLPLLPRGSPVSSMHWQAGFLTAQPATRDGWWLLQTLGDYAEKGCSSQRMNLWNAAGDPVIAAMQSVALFG